MMRVLLLLTLFGLPMPAFAHEMGTSALIISEWQAGQGTLVFKRSKSADGTVPPIEFQFVPACTLSDARTEWEEDNEVIQQASFNCKAALSDHRLMISGFTRLSPDLIAKVQTLGQPDVVHVLSPRNNAVDLGQSLQAGGTAFSDYLLIGVEHIVLGWDHVLFVMALYLLWQRRNESLTRLMALFSVFTLGHSLTLALVVLDLISVPTRAIEAWIALSVLWLAVQLAQTEKASEAGQTQLKQTPLGHHVLVLLFGLLHGSGFALSMEERGFPEGSLLSTLLAFNVGIELGQLLIVVALLILFRLLTLPRVLPFGRHAETGFVLLIGGASLFWTVERVSSYV